MLSQWDCFHNIPSPRHLTVLCLPMSSTSVLYESSNAASTVWTRMHNIYMMIGGCNIQGMVNNVTNKIAGVVM